MSQQQNEEGTGYEDVDDPVTPVFDRARFVELRITPVMYSTVQGLAVLQAHNDGRVFLTPEEEKRLRMGLCSIKAGENCCDIDCDCAALLRSVIAPRFNELLEKGIL
jgi:hypothetical protein